MLYPTYDNLRRRRLIVAGLAAFADWKLSQDVIWEKNTGTSLARDRFRRVHELALHWYRGAWRDVYHETPTTNDATARTIRRKARSQHQGACGSSIYTSEDGGPRLMRSIMFARNMKGRAINETEKPVPVLEPLIQYACPPGGLVIDLFSGSSAALVAAQRTGRRAIGFEMRESQCEQAARRLSQGLLVRDMP
ncbi:MAG: site-specific DNA-methyltransferase [Nostocoides sp.]